MARYELKFWAGPHDVERVLSQLDGLLLRDPHMPEQRKGYRITSLYFDTERFDFFVDKVEGLKHRVKIRLRRYDNEQRGFAEIKLRIGKGIRKYRVPFDEESMAALSSGDLRPLQDAASDNDEHRALHARMILREMTIRPVEPAVITVYEREAYMFKDDPTLRVTFDRDLSCCGDDLSARFFDHRDSLVPMTLAPELGILEVKSTGPVPSVIATAVRRVGLRRESISKYCISVALTRSHSVVEHCRSSVLREQKYG